MNYMVVLLSLLAMVSMSFAEDDDLIKTKVEKFPVKKLRLGASYYFKLDFNAGKNPVGVNHVSTRFRENGDFDGSGKGAAPRFDWTENIIQAKYKLSSHERSTIVKSKDIYPIKFHPKKRSTDNIVIQYKTKYYYNVDGKWYGPAMIISEQPYEITWCGDGILDNYYDGYLKKQISEECDPADIHKQNWGDKGCSKVCKKIQ